MDRREVDQALLARGADADGGRRVAVELDVGDPHQVVPARPERLRDDHQNVILDGDVAGDGAMAAGDGEVAAIDGVMRAQLAMPLRTWQAVCEPPGKTRSDGHLRV